MTKSLCILAILSFIAAVICTASIAAAGGCTACGGEQNWDASATSFLEGKSIENLPAPKWGPAAVREKNSQFSANSTNDEAKAAPEDSANAAQAAPSQGQNIVLKNASAVPSTASPGSPVTITAVLAGTKSAYALIDNFAGVQVGNVTLEQSSGEEYVGTWTASIATGAYKATIVASGEKTSMKFTDALQIEITDTNSAAGNSRFKKLG